MKSLTAEEFTGTTIADGDIVWRAVPYEGAPTTWGADTKYEGGECVIGVDASGHVGVMWQVFSIGKRSGEVQPTFNTDIGIETKDADVIWTTKDINSFEQETDKAQYLAIEKEITVS